METSSLHLPFLVYGTLRPGERNYRALRLGSRTRHAGTVTLPGYAMYNAGGFPYAVHTGRQRDVIIADALEARPGAYRSLLDDIDALEGYSGVRCDNHYEREGIGYMRAGEDADAGEGWLYTANPWIVEHVIVAHHLERIPGGNWLTR